MCIRDRGVECPLPSSCCASGPFPCYRFLHLFASGLPLWLAVMLGGGCSWRQTSECQTRPWPVVFIFSEESPSGGGPGSFASWVIQISPMDFLCLGGWVLPTCQFCSSSFPLTV